GRRGSRPVACGTGWAGGTPGRRPAPSRRGPPACTYVPSASTPIMRPPAARSIHAGERAVRGRGSDAPLRLLDDVGELVPDELLAAASAQREIASLRERERAERRAGGPLVDPDVVERPTTHGTRSLGQQLRRGRCFGRRFLEEFRHGRSFLAWSTTIRC